LSPAADHPGTTISAGILEARVLANGNAPSSIGASSNAAHNLIFGAASATLRYIGSTDVTINRSFTMSSSANGGATIESSGTGTLSFDDTVPIAYGTPDEIRILTLGGTNLGANTFGKTITNNRAATTSLVKSGIGKWILTGTHAYSGATTITGGTLAINGALANTTTTVTSGGLLQGTGIISGSLTVQDGGTLASGDSIQSLATGPLTLNAGSTFAYDINNDASLDVAGDLTAVTGDLSLDLSNLGILSLTELGSGAWTEDTKLTLISYAGDWNGGMFTYNGAILGDDTTFSFSRANWLINYDDTIAGTNYVSDLTGSRFVTMTIIPEPCATMLAGLGILTFLRRRR